MSGQRDTIVSQKQEMRMESRQRDHLEVGLVGVEIQNVQMMGKS